SIHAEATSTKVTLTYTTETFRLNVCDDGVGFEPELVLTQREGCLGVLGMHERAQHLGGTLTIKSMPGQGTEVVLDLPTAGRPETAPEQVEEPGNGARVASYSHPRGG
ncbi:MAG TPA: ATP-binding protein, partial [Ktedonobacterales bacterium]|nr:ATP-binding protein [Ktedonobacterales bacterium]